VAAQLCAASYASLVTDTVFSAGHRFLQFSTMISTRK
jgi:hypothetical protein